VRDESHERETGAGGTALAEEPGSDLRSRVRAYERGLLLSALQATGGNQRRAAATLGLLATTFHEKLKRHGIRARPASDPDADGSDDDVR
jgi:DNA-binding NtrC family response regulator